MSALWVFLAAFAAVAVLIVFLTGGQRKMWKERPAAMRAFAGRRGFQVVENPGKAGDLIPLRPVEKSGTVKELELPLAVRGRSLDTQLTLVDVCTMVETGAGSHKSLLPTYDTFITFKSAAVRWPHFEFAAISHLKADSLTGNLMTMVANATGSIAEKRGLKHVPIPDDPGCQLYMGDTTHATAARDALMKLFAAKEGWWVGARDDVVTMQKVARKSPATQNFVPSEELDRFVDEAIEIERGLRALATPQ